MEIFEDIVKTRFSSTFLTPNPSRSHTLRIKKRSKSDSKSPLWSKSGNNEGKAGQCNKENVLSCSPMVNRKHSHLLRSPLQPLDLNLGVGRKEYQRSSHIKIPLLVTPEKRSNPNGPDCPGDTIIKFSSSEETEIQGDHFWAQSDEEYCIETAVPVDCMLAAVNIWDIKEQTEHITVDEMSENETSPGSLSWYSCEPTLKQELFPQLHILEEPEPIKFPWY